MYSRKVIDCFLDAKNIGVVDGYNARGFEGSIECGDALEVTLKIEDEVIIDAKFRAYGCTAAIASGEALVQLVKGKNIAKAMEITNRDICDFLEGLPAVKIHCSVMGEEVLERALKNYIGVDCAGTDDNVLCRCAGVTVRQVQDAILVDKQYTIRNLEDSLCVGIQCKKCREKIYNTLKVALQGENDLS